jgi:beta-galactosidase
VIEATSPNLPSAQIAITSRNAPAYIAGKTREAVPGPYIRFVSTRSTAEEVADITLDRPTNASSMAPDHQSRLASDGDPRTYWSAAPDAVGPQWWESDLEGVYVLSAVTLRFVHPGSYRYEIQTSTDDRMTWHTGARGDVQFTGTPVTVQLPSNTLTSGIRIVFDRTPGDTPTSLSEVQARGARAR